MAGDFVVSVEIEHSNGLVADTWLYGPFRTRERAVRFAERVGLGSGLNRNTYGDWAGTDGEDRFAFVHIQSIISPTVWRTAIETVRRFFTAKEEA